MTNAIPQAGQDFDAARRVMVASQLRPQGVTDAHVLGAMGAVPREDYVGPDQRSVAYGDRSLLLDDDAPMMGPAELGQLLNRLAPVPGERALVVGGGGAYAAAILRHIGLIVETTHSAEKSGSDPFDLILVEGAIEDGGFTSRRLRRFCRLFLHKFPSPCFGGRGLTVSLWWGARKCGGSR